MGLSLVMLDTDKIKDYVFATDTLGEIRGASSLLDHLNRDVMVELAEGQQYGGKKIYANGGTGLFLIDSDQAEEFGRQVQQEYQHLTAGGASVTYVVQPLPKDAPKTLPGLMEYDIRHTLALLRHRLREQKGNPHPYNDEATHPLMRLCDSCGTYYTVIFKSNEQEFYCQSCLNKQVEDERVRDELDRWTKSDTRKSANAGLWNNVLELFKRFNYRIPPGTQRPQDLNVFGEFRQSKDYLGLIYADANGMGRKIEDCKTLQETHDFAKKIDDVVYLAMCSVINDYLTARQLRDEWVFPFDILLIGGDDIVLVTPAAQAVPVAHVLAERFYEYANSDLQQSNGEQDQKHKEDEEEDQGEDKKHSLSVGVVLAPTNYPFSLLKDLAEETLKSAKKDGSKAKGKKTSEYGKTRVNYLVVSGSTSQSLDKVEKSWRRSDKPSNSRFNATMRPYTLEQLKFLLDMLQEGSRLALGRSKLQQLREAVLHLNRSTSVTESLAVLRSWKPRERDFVAKEVYRTERKYPLAQRDEQHPDFPKVTFPWIVDENKETKITQYSTILYDFVDLYDFVVQEDRSRHDQD